MSSIEGVRITTETPQVLGVELQRNVWIRLMTEYRRFTNLQVLADRERSGLSPHETLRFAGTSFLTRSKQSEPSEA